MDVVTKFISKSTVLVRAYVYDEDDALTDPTTSITVTIVDPAGTTKVDNVAMTKHATGVYDYFYNTAADSVEGNWVGEVTTGDGSGEDAKTAIATFSFEVKKGL